MSLIYLASPYSHPDPDVRQRRYVEACMAAAKLMEEGAAVFSPIAHGHSVAEHGGLPAMDHEFWMAQCLPWVERCDELVILTLDGWRESRGIQCEIAQASLVDIPVRLLEP
jgi:nucleoside 2-deoxyribosyltransferase